MIDNKPAIICDNFRGLFDQGHEDNVPADHFISTLNCVPKDSGFETREGSILSITLANVLRFHVYKRLGEAQRLLILTTGGNLYDSLDVTTPILTIASMSDFSMVTMFNRAYITPHNGNKGLGSEFVYIYNGSGVCRKAAGVAPTGFLLSVIASTASGTVEAGNHIFGVAYETASGFITAPGPDVKSVHDAPGDKKVTIANIIAGPTGTVARHIVGTKTIVDYNGDQVNQQYYFVPGGYIADNSTTQIDVDFYDADLMESADYLFDQLAEIPASLGLGDYQGSMVTYGEDNYDSIVRVSVIGKPESFAETDGFATIDPGDGEGIKSVVEYRGSLIICKAKRTYSTTSNGSNAAYWPIVPIDKSVGTEVFGICQILDARGSSTDTILIADRSGLLLYDGTYRMCLTDKIREIWHKINQVEFHQVQVCLDPTTARIYINLPYLDSNVCNYVLMGDYQNGLDKENIRWYKWQFPQHPKCIGVDVDNATKVPIFKYGGTNIYVLDTTARNDYNNAINCYAQCGLLHFKYSDVYKEYVNNFSDIRARITGSGNVTVSLSNFDSVDTMTLSTKTLATAPGRLVTWRFNYNAERISVKFAINSAGSYFNVTRFSVFGNELWKERPA